MYLFRKYLWGELFVNEGQCQGCPCRGSHQLERCVIRIPAVELNHEIVQPGSLEKTHPRSFINQSCQLLNVSKSVILLFNWVVQDFLCSEFAWGSTTHKCVYVCFLYVSCCSYIPTPSTLHPFFSGLEMSRALWHTSSRLLWRRSQWTLGFFSILSGLPQLFLSSSTVVWGGKHSLIAISKFFTC